MIDTLLKNFGLINFFIVLTILVFLHELGHYLLARACKVKVEVFSIGFGPEIAGFTDKAGTRWRFSMIPLGGYVKMLGEMIPQTADKIRMVDQTIAAKDLPTAFHKKSVWQRAIIVAAGPIANVLAAFGFLAILSLSYGITQDIKPQPLPDIAVVGMVNPRSAAEFGGLKTGDKILTITDQRGQTTITKIEDVVNTLKNTDGGDLTITIFRPKPEILTALQQEFRQNIGQTSEHDLTIAEKNLAKEKRQALLNQYQTYQYQNQPSGQVLTLTIRPNPGASVNGKTQYRLGIGFFAFYPPLEFEKVGVGKALSHSLNQTYDLTKEMLQGIGKLFTGQANLNQLGGPVMIAKISSDVGALGLYALTMFMVVLSLNLAVINLFPIPALDGGHLLLLAIEQVIGRPVPAVIQQGLMVFGFALLMSLAVLITIKDIWQLFLS